MNIITDTSRSHRTPCEIESVTIVSSFTVWGLMSVVVVVVVVTVVVVLVVTIVVIVKAVLFVVVIPVVLEVVLVVVLLVVVLVRALVCAGAFIGASVEVLTVGMGVEVVIIVSNMAAGLLMDALRSIIRGVMINIDGDMLVEVNAKVFAGLMITFEFIMPERLEEFCCC